MRVLPLSPPPNHSMASQSTKRNIRPVNKNSMTEQEKKTIFGNEYLGKTAKTDIFPGKLRIEFDFGQFTYASLIFNIDWTVFLSSLMSVHCYSPPICTFSGHLPK